MENPIALSFGATGVSDLDLIQWPAMLATVAAAWYVASSHARRRHIGFWVFIASNVLWVVWGLHARAYALIVLQICLAAMNIRGARKSEDPAATEAESP
jgi:hypothetical protein